MGDLQGTAIIGIHGRFPGARSVEELWDVLVEGRETITFFSDAELVESGVDPEAARKDAHYVPCRGILQDGECFDAAFFGVQPKEAEVMDPQHRIFLEGCWEALERAGYAPNRLKVPVGIYSAATFNTYYLHALHTRADLRETVGRDQVLFGNEKDYLATRVAYKLNLRGPAINVDTACSSSLTAICQACQSLLTYQCDMAIAGGVSLTVPQKRGYAFQEGNIGSPDGHTRTFDKRAGGTVFSNGLALVVLKRLEDAIADGDEIHGVIRGFALNNDGAQRVSFGAPGVEGQAEVISLAQAVAGVRADSITYVEAHGTATPVGDPIEVTALTKAFREDTDRKQFCALGSIKSNIGHLDAAAGAAGLIKTVLALRHRQIPASLHFTEPNPGLQLEESPFFVNATLRRWTTEDGGPLRAGVSAFGSGGTNAHVVLEEPPERPASDAPSRAWQLLPLSTRTAESLDVAARDLAAHLRERTDLCLADVAYTLQTGRAEFAHRRAVVCGSPADAVEVLEGRDPDRLFSGRQELTDPPVVFMFPGQGAQYVGMGAELYRQEPLFRSEVDRCANILAPVMKVDLRSVLFPAPGEEARARSELTQTRFTQPALFVIELALAKLWMSWGIEPAAMIGHSIGEYVAACLAGVLSLEDALDVVARRGELVQSMPAGAMLAVRLSEAELLPLLNGHVTIAAVNSPRSCVVAGSEEAIQSVELQLAAKGAAVRRLETSHAFHSAMMDPVLAPFSDVLREKRLAPPRLPYVSNVTASWIKPEEANSPDYWARHARQTVRFSDGLAELMAVPEHVFLEVGPGQTLSRFTRQQTPDGSKRAIIPSLSRAGGRELAALLGALGRLWLAGAEVDWKGFYRDERRRRVVLPTYPFEKRRYWPETPAGRVESRTAAAAAVATGLAETSRRVDSAEIPRGRPPVPVTAGPSVTRREHLATLVKALLQDLSGVPLESVDGAAKLLELGFDSLLLTQAATLMQKRFGVPVKFRQLMESLSTIDSLASYLDENLPRDAFRPPAPESALAAPSPAAGAPAESAPPASGAGIIQLLEQQLRVTTQLLDAVRGGADPREALPRRGGETTPGTAPPSPVAPSRREPEAPARHGPFRPFDRRADTRLNERQAKHLDSLISRYTARTAASRNLAERNRPSLADPRSVAGFKPLWKDMVYPIYSVRSDGSRIWDVDGNEYIDFVMGFTASLFGHRPPFVVEAVKAQLDAGFELGPIHPLAGEVAALIRELTGVDRVAFCNTGSEAVLAAMRVARTVTGRDKIAMFAGAYHGIFDEVLARPVGEGRGAPIAPGIPRTALGEILVCEYGNPESIELLKRHRAELAAVLVEPVQSRRLDLQPREFLHDLRRFTEESGIALVFDEIVTGFRLGPGGAQSHFDVKADIATFGKVAGGGLPIGIVGGRREFMDALDGGDWRYGDDSFPEVGVTFFAGTFVRHPLALAAAKAVLTHLKNEGPELQRGVARKAERTAGRLRELFSSYGAPFRVSQFSSMVTIDVPPEFTYGALLFYHLRLRGIHAWENRNVTFTTAHAERDEEALIERTRESLEEMRTGGFLPSGDGGGPAAGSREPELAVDGGERVEFPLTDAQEEIWLTARLGADAFRSYNNTFVIHLRGRLDRAALERSIQELVDRHDSLRVSFDAETPVQRFRPRLAVSLPPVDLSAHPPAERSARAAELVREQAERDLDLEVAPLMRLELIRLSEDEHSLVLMLSHLIADGWSVGVLLHELRLLYEAHCTGQAISLDPALQYADYVRRLSSPENRSAIDAAVVFWRERFSTIPSTTALPEDRPRSAEITFRAARKRVLWDGELSRAIRAASARHGTTVFTFLLAVFKTWVHRLTGQEDLVVGIPAAGQISPSLDSIEGSRALVGHCVNLLPLRSSCRGDSSFADYLAQLRGDVLDAYEHQSLTFGRLIQTLKVPREPGRVPLVPIVFNLDRTASGFGLHGLETRIEELARTSLIPDLAFNVVDDDRAFLVDCHYRTDLFDEATIDRWLEYYRNVLRRVVACPKTMIDEIEILAEQERNELLFDRDERSGPYEHGKVAPIHTLFEAQVERTPDRVAVVSGPGGLTYRELNARANQLAHHLRERGVGVETLVGICVERTADLVVGILGILKAGGAYVPIDLSYPPERLAFILEDARAPVLLTQRALKSRIPAIPAQVVCLEDVFETREGAPCRDDLRPPQASPSPLPAAHADSLAYVIYTSGTTGQPKGSLVTHRNVARLFAATEKWFRFDESDVWTLFHSCAFDFSVWEIWGALLYGGRLVVVPFMTSRSPEAFYNLLARERVTVLNQTPSAFRQLVAAEEAVGEKPLALRYVIFGGEALEMQTLRPWFRRHGDRRPQLVNMYGITETTVHVTYRPLSEGDVKGGSVIGVPIPDLRVYILDPRGNPVPVGVPGEMYVGGAGVCRGYLNRPELTAERFIVDPFRKESESHLYRTGDLARWLSNRDIEYLGRIDHQVKIRGFRIELGEIEAALLEHPAIAESVVVAREDEPEEKRLVAYVVGSGRKGADISDVRAHLKRKLPEYMVPAAIVELERLPLTPNGKVDRKALPAPDPSREALGNGYTAPSSVEEEGLSAIWSEVLRIDRIGVDDDFFELGGHSLLAVQIVSRIRAVFGVDLTLSDVFERPTIAGLTRALRTGRSGVELPAVVPVSREQDLPVSFGQQRLWFLGLLEPESPFYNVPLSIRFVGKLDLEAIEHGLREILRRHEALRTVIRTAADGQPVQVVLEDAGFELPVVDLSALPAIESDAEARRLAREEWARPLDLERGPVLRATLVRVGEEDHRLLLNLHHAVVDEWSINVLLEELGACYRARVSGTPPGLTPLPIQYPDFAVWQRRWLQGEELARQLSYWTEQLRDLTTLELATDHPRPARQTFRGGWEEIVLPAALGDEIRALSRRENTTFFMTLLAAFNALLARYTGQEDLVVGTPIANRGLKEVEGLIGLFVNTVVMRTDASGDPSFRELLGRVREMSLEAFAHQDLPFEKLVEELHPERDLSRNPLFQVMFVHESGPKEQWDVDGLAVSFYGVEIETTHLDLELCVAEGDGGIKLGLVYSRDLFEAATIRRMLRHLRTLIEGAVADPEKRLSTLPLLSDEERDELLLHRNSTAVDFPRDVPVHRLFERQVERTPDRIALECEDDRLSYRELNSRANRLARHLRGRGVMPEDLVGICMKRSTDLVVGLLGILKAGGTYVPLDPDHPRERLSFILEDAGARLVLTHSYCAEAVSVPDADVVCLDSGLELTGPEASNPPLNVSGDHLAYVIYTSGSTGQPKGVEIPHRALTNFLLSMRGSPGLVEDDVLLAVTTPSFDIAALELYLPLVVGARLVVAGRDVTRDGAGLANQLETSGVTVMQATPATWQLLLETGWKGRPELRMLCGGEALSRQLADRLLEKGGELWNMYGPTETTIWSTISKVERGSESVSIGRPIMNTRVYVLDRRRALVPDAAIGELYIGGEGVARGYHNRPELTEERFVPNPFTGGVNDRLYRTGDRARYRSDGTLECLGRLDFQVKIRGLRIEPGEIEAALLERPSIDEAVVVVLGDEPDEKRLVGYVVSSGESRLDTDEVREHLKKKLPSYMVPWEIVELDGLPRTPNGKVDLKRLPRPERVGRARVAVCRDELELRLASIWQELLKTRNIGPDDDFFELGGHSIVAARLFVEIEKVFGKALPLATLFEAPSVRQLAAIIRSEGWKPRWKSLVAIRSSGTRPPLFLVHGAEGNVLLYRDLARHLGPDQPVFALQYAGLADRSSCPTRIEDMAGSYVEEIRSVQPHGPYYLGGYCLGGTIALEMAHQLRSQGDDVGLVALLETYNIKAQNGALTFWNRKTQGLQNILFHLNNLMSLKMRERWPFLKQKLRVEAGRIKLPWSGDPGDHGTSPLSVRKLNDQAQLDYTPKPYGGRVALLRPKTHFAGYDDRSFGWRDIVMGDLRICTLPVYPRAILVEPFVRLLATTLAGVLRDCESDPGETCAVSGLAGSSAAGVG